MNFSKFIGFAVLALIGHAAPATSAEDCNTALSRIARKAVENLIVKYRGNACTGVKVGPLVVDKTRRVEVREFQLCEDGSVVAGSVTVNVECATSDRGAFRATISDNITAVATVNLDTCQVTGTSISAGKRLCSPARAGR